MRAVVQRVRHASVTVNDEVVGAIGHGLLVLLSAGDDDDDTDVAWMVDKLIGLRIFADAEGRMNRDVRHIGGAILLVSQFTLHGDVRKGRRPSFMRAMAPEAARELVQRCARGLASHRVDGPAGDAPLDVQQGVFGASMQVSLLNDGPVTILIDSKRTF